MSKTTAYANGLLQLVFNNQDLPLIGDAAGLQNSATTGSLYVSLHTATPNVGGDQSSSEITYTSYARVAIARTTGGWAVSGNSVSPVAAITFPAGTGGSGTATHWGIGTAASGAGSLLYFGTISPNIVTGNGITPQLTTASSVTEA